MSKLSGVVQNLKRRSAGVGSLGKTPHRSCPRCNLRDIAATLTMTVWGRETRVDERLSSYNTLHTHYWISGTGRAPESLVDLIFSTATFHWIKVHDRLCRRLAHASKPQGRLVAQCWGKENLSRTRNAMEQVMGEGRFPKLFTGLENPWNSAAATTKARLEAAGFGEVNTWLREERTEFDSMAEVAHFLKTVVFGHHLERLPESRGNTLVLWWPHGSHTEESSSWTTSA